MSGFLVGDDVVLIGEEGDDPVYTVGKVVDVDRLFEDETYSVAVAERIPGNFDSGITIKRKYRHQLRLA